MKINTGQGTISSYYAYRYLVCFCTDLIAGLGCFAYFGRTFYDFSPCHGVGYTDVDFFAFLADYPFCTIGR